ncbi:esterase/lipase family protein [Rhodoblastus sp.]|uniref:esterase/lipase family protein n=1 Tax=Rhodoblastus sp. TaxID=1962975 RepID=UPI003F9D2AE9
MLACALKGGLILRLLGSALAGVFVVGSGEKSWALASLLFFLLADGPLLALDYLQSHWKPASIARGAGFFHACAAGLREWAAFTLFYVIIQPFERFWMGEDICGPVRGDSFPVVLAHGYCCNRGVWFWMRGRLLPAGLQVATVNFEPVFADIEFFAEQLHARIETVLAQTGAQKLVIAAHSMGGLVARAYLRRHGEEKIVALVTIGTPHHGTIVARFGPGRNARQMEPDNGWLNDLNATKVTLPVTSVASAGDEIVAPQDSALWPGADQRVLAGQDHFGLVLSEQVASIVRDAARAPAVQMPRSTSLSAVA